MERPRHEVVDLTYSSDDENLPLKQNNPVGPVPEEKAPAKPLSTAQPMPAAHEDSSNQELAQPAVAYASNIARYATAQATQLGPLDGSNTNPLSQGAAGQLSSNSTCGSFTLDICLQRVLELFPDVNREHVVALYTKFGDSDDYQPLPGPARLDNIIEHLLQDSNYPRQEQTRRGTKRKREGSTDVDMDLFGRPDRPKLGPAAFQQAATMLKMEFPHIPTALIRHTLDRRGNLYQAYITLAHDVDTLAAFRREKAAQQTNGVYEQDSLFEELQAARLKLALIRSEQSRAEEEQLNFQTAKQRGEIADCEACYDEYPKNRMIQCEGPTPHSVCFSCAETYVKTEVGSTRGHIECVAGCQHKYAHGELQKLSDKALLEQLAKIEQQNAIREAGLDDLEDCPFCDFKMEMPPVEENFIFVCQNPECGKSSCRRCKHPSHLPLSCEQYAKDHKIDTRHKIEEAMTAAMVRKCNRCEKKFIKEYGCNKITCPTCRNVQCYICSATVQDYDHFNDSRNSRVPDPRGKCPLFDPDVEKRHMDEVETARVQAKNEVLAENPDIAPEDLEIKISDEANRAGAERRVRARGRMARLNALNALDHPQPLNRDRLGAGDLQQPQQNQAYLEHIQVQDQLRVQYQQQRLAQLRQHAQQQLQQRQQLLAQNNGRVRALAGDMVGGGYGFDLPADPALNRAAVVEGNIGRNFILNMPRAALGMQNANPANELPAVPPILEWDLPNNNFDLGVGDGANPDNVQGDYYLRNALNMQQRNVAVGNVRHQADHGGIGGNGPAEPFAVHRQPAPALQPNLMPRHEQALPTADGGLNGVQGPNYIFNQARQQADGGYGLANRHHVRNRHWRSRAPGAQILQPPEFPAAFFDPGDRAAALYAHANGLNDQAAGGWPLDPTFAQDNGQANNDNYGNANH